MEYSFQVWRPWLKKDIKLLEDVQRRSPKLMKGLNDTEYERGDKGDMILVFKILLGFLETRLETPRDPITPWCGPPLFCPCFSFAETSVLNIS